MPKLPTEDDLGGSGPRSARSPVQPSQGGEIIAKAAQRLGQTAGVIGADMIREQAEADTLKADDYFTSKRVEIARSFDEDPDYSTYGPRAESALKAEVEAAAGMIRSPAVRERWKQRANTQSIGVRDSIEQRGKTLRKQQSVVELENSLGTWTQEFLLPDKDETGRQTSLRSMEDRIDAELRAGRITPSDAQSLKEKHLGKALEFYHERRLLDDPESAIEELESLGRTSGVDITPSTIPRSSNVGRPRTAPVVGMVVHETQGSDTMEGNASWSNKKNTGANYYIDKKGRIIEWAPDNIAMNHAGIGRGVKGDVRPDLGNANTISVEIMTRPGEKPNEAQKDALRRLSLAKASQYGFKPQDIEAHGRLAPGHKMADEATDAVDYVRSNWEDEVKVADASGETVPELRRAASPYDRYLTPDRRQALLTRSRVALSATMQQSVNDDIERIRRGEEPARDAKGRTSIEIAERVLTPNQSAKLRFAWEEAGMEHRAIAPLSMMSDQEAMEHIEKIAPSNASPTESYKSAARVQAKAIDEWKRIKKERAEDQAGSVIKDPSVRMVAEMVGKKYPEAGVQIDENGNIGVGQTDVPELPGDREKALDLVFQARLEAQERRGIPEFQRKILTKAEAEDLIPDLRLEDEGSAVRLLREAAANAEAKYGRHAKQAFKDAIRLTKMSKEQDELAAGILAKMAFNEPVGRLEISRAQSYRGIVRGADSFLSADTGSIDPTAFNPGSPGLSPANVGTMAALTEQQGQAARRTPNQAQIEWAMQDPARRQPTFDQMFGPGAYARAVQSSRMSNPR